jgi:hypothetical protein
MRPSVLFTLLLILPGVTFLPYARGASALVLGGVEQKEAEAEPAGKQEVEAVDAPADRAVDADGAPQRAFHPRLELWVPSAKRLIDEVIRSHSGPFVEPLGRMLAKSGESKLDGQTADGVAALIGQIREWPDAALVAVTYAPDLDGRARWVVRLNWPMAELHERVAGLLELEAAGELLEGVSIRSITPVEAASVGSSANGASGYQVFLPEAPLFYLLPAGDNKSYVASHPDLDVPRGLLGGVLDEDDTKSGWLVTARLNFAQTEVDSGGTWLSGFSAVTALDYVGTVSESGEWTETVQIHWPAISGMGARAFFNRVEQSFYVPKAAFGAAVLNVPIVSGMLDGMAGLGPQVVMDAPGRMEVVGEPTPGPIALHSDSDVCFTMLPGTGFLPFPDIVVQVRVRRSESLVESLEGETKRINKLYADRDQPEPWHQTHLRDRAVFWSEPTGPGRGLMMPVVMRPVLFTTTEKDARDRERSFLVLGLTSTRPEELVDRWLNFPRTMEFHHLPSERRMNGQIWMNWQALYAWVSPYLNVALSSAGADVLLPAIDQVKDRLTDGSIAVEVKYAGMTATHRGPVPGGVIALPAMISSSIQPDRRGGSDLARERLARERLHLLYHHCELFRKDLGRWPAEIGELEGYVDFAGHPELLQLRVSSKKAWSELLSGMFERKKADALKADEEDELGGSVVTVKTDLYVIDWGRDRWTLGFKPGTFEHLERLYIDHDGEIHRVTRAVASETNQVDDGTNIPSQATEDENNDESAEVNGKE